PRSGRLRCSARPSLLPADPPPASAPRPMTHPLPILFKVPSTPAIYTLSLHDALPIYQSERGEPPESRVRGERDRATRVLAREDVAYPALRGRSRCLDYVRHAEACERRLRLVGAPLLEEVTRRLGDRAREHEQDEPGRQADEPEEAPARVGNDQRRGVARRDVAADAADRA